MDIHGYLNLQNKYIAIEPGLFYNGRNNFSSPRLISYMSLVIYIIDKGLFVA